MAERIVKVMTDQWGHTPGFARGTMLLINDDKPDEMTYHLGDGSAPRPIVADVDWAIGVGAVQEVDENGNPLGSVAAPRPAAFSRLPIGNEAAIDRGAPSDPDFVPVPSGSADPEAGELTMAPNPHPVDAPDASEAGLTPAQKAARTRAEKKDAE